MAILCPAFLGWPGSEGFGRIAGHLLHDGLFSSDGLTASAERMPIYPLILAAVMKIGGADWRWWAVATNAFALMACGGMATRLCARLQPGPKAAWACALVLSFHVTWSIEALAFRETVWFSLMVVGLAAIFSTPRIGVTRVVLAGACAGIAYLLRPTGFLVIMMLPAWLWISRRSLVWRIGPSIAVAMAMAAMFVAPWQIYVWRTLGHPQLSNNEGGNTAIKGSRPEFWEVVPWADLDLLEPLVIADAANAGINTPSKRDDYWRKEAIAIVLADPGNWLAKGVVKTFGMISPVTVPFGTAVLIRRGSALKREGFKWDPWAFSSVPAVLLIFFGAARRWWRWRELEPLERALAGSLALLLVAIGLLHAAISGETRYRLPFDPLLMVLAAPEVANWCKNLWQKIATTGINPFSEKQLPLLRSLPYAVVIGVFLWICAHFYLPGKGFTYLIMFGDQVSSRTLPELRAVGHYEEKDSDGYDAQYYAQIAMHPSLGDRSLHLAIDNVAYRARRILFCWTAWAAGLGDPARILYIYAIQNIVTWLILAWLLLRWFPATNWGNFSRWGAVLFSFGLCVSVRGSLVDGPSLLLIAASMTLAEMGRGWWSAGLLGVAGLGKETNILAAVALPAPRRWEPGPWAEYLCRLALILAPLAGWLFVLKLWLGDIGDTGARNFNWPFCGYLASWQDVFHRFQNNGFNTIDACSLCLLAALSAQWLFFALRPRWQEPWWRIGAAYALLMVFLGDAVWEGYPGASARVLLPMGLAFNILVPRGRAWLLVLLLGNLTIFFALDTLRPPGLESAVINGPPSLRVAQESGNKVEVSFSDTEWYLPEHSRFDYWRWSRGSATIIFRNPQTFSIQTDITFDIKSRNPRIVTVRTFGEGLVLWKGETMPTQHGVTLRGVVLQPGETVLRFDTDQPAQSPGSGDSRKIAFSVWNLEVNITGRAVP